MSVHWYEWANIRNRLLTFGRAIQGAAPYRVRFEPDPDHCAVGYCDFARREIVVNPAAFAAPPKEQFQLSKAVLVHEAGHRRFTTPFHLAPVARIVANVLEDERVERCMAAEFAGVRGLLLRLARVLYREAPPVDETSPCSGEVVSYFLQARWALRLGQPIKGRLSPPNEERWRQVEPLVYAAWEADASTEVERRAEEIVQLLGLEEGRLPLWVRTIAARMGTREGQRADEDRAESATGKESKSDPAAEAAPDPLPFDGEIPPNDARLGRGNWAIEPKPYLAIEERVEPLVQELIAELAWEERPTGEEPVARGGRLSVREYLRDRERPFLDEREPGSAPPTLALKVVIDHSSSMNWGVGLSRMEEVTTAVMALHLVCVQLDIPHEVLVTPQALVVADLASGERGKALIAGLIPALCDFEDLGRTLRNHVAPLAHASQAVKLALCLTDGACNDAHLAQMICRALRGKVEVIGILLDPDATSRQYLVETFGEDRMIACAAEELPRKLGAILRAVYGV